MSGNTVVIRINVDGKQATAEISGVGQALDGLGKTTGPAGVANALASLQTPIGATRRGVAGIGTQLDDLRASVGRLAQLGGFALLARSAASFYGEAAMAGVQAQRLANTLTYASGSADEAAANQAFLSTTVRTLGLDSVSASAAFASLAAAAKGTALEGQGARSIFDAVAKASTVMGLSVEQTDGALLALQQMISKGTVSAEELRGQLGERLPGAFQIAARAMGVTTGELGKMLEQGNLATDVFLPRFAAQIRVEMGGAVESAADSVQANLNRVGNAWQALLTTVNSSGFNAQSLKGLELALASASRVLAASESDWKGWGDTVAKVLAGVADGVAGGFAGPRAVITQVTSTWSSAKAQAERLLDLGADIAKTGGKNRASIEAEFASRNQAIQSGYESELTAILKGNGAFKRALAAEQADRSSTAAAAGELNARDALRRFNADQQLLSTPPKVSGSGSGKAGGAASKRQPTDFIGQAEDANTKRLQDWAARNQAALDRVEEAETTWWDRLLQQDATAAAQRQAQADDFAGQTMDAAEQLNAGLIADDRQRGLAQIELERSVQQDRLDAMTRAGTDTRAAQDALNAYILAKQAALTDQLKPQWQRNLETWQDHNGLMRTAWDETMSHLQQAGEDAWVQFATTGKLNVRSLIDGLMADLARVQFRDSIAPAFTSAAKSVLGVFLPQPAGAAAPSSDTSKATEKAGAALGASAAGLTDAAQAFNNPVEGLLGAGKSLVQSALGWLFPQAMQTTAASTLDGAAMAMGISAQALLSAAGALATAASLMPKGSPVPGVGGGGDGGGIVAMLASVFAANGAVVDGAGWHPAAAFAAGGAFGQGEVLTQPTLFRFRQAGAVRLGLAGEAGAEAALPLRSGGVTASVAGRSAGSMPLTRNGGLLGVDLTAFVAEMQGRVAQRFAAGGTFGGGFDSAPSPGSRSGGGGNAAVATRAEQPAVVVHQTLVFHGDGVNRTEMAKYGKRIRDETVAVVMDKIRRGRRD